MKEPKIAIIIINYNGQADTIECLHSLQKIDYHNYEIIVVDNNSCDDSVEKIKSCFPSIHLIASQENLGFAGGNNLAISYALKNSVDYIFLLNNDTIVDRYILTAFVKAANEKPSGGVFGAKIFCYGTKDDIDHYGGFWQKEIAEFISASPKTRKKNFFLSHQKVDYVCGCSFFVKRELIEKIGLLDEKFFLIWEEADYCFRAKQAGYESWAIKDAYIWHKISSSFSGRIHMHYYWWRNRLLWIEKNCSAHEKKIIYKKIIIPEALHLFKLKMLRSFQLFFSFFIFWHPTNEKRKEKYLLYKAGIQGIEDYLFRRFGQGPKWLTKTKKK